MAEAIDRRAIQEALECIRVNRAHQQEHPQLFAEFLDLLAAATTDALSLARSGDPDVGFEEVDKLLNAQALINKMLARLLINSQYERMGELVFASREDVLLCSSLVHALGNILDNKHGDLKAMSRRLYAADPGSP